jgi:hypothetical protein
MEVVIFLHCLLSHGGSLLSNVLALGLRSICLRYRGIQPFLFFQEFKKQGFQLRALHLLVRWSTS